MRSIIYVLWLKLRILKSDAHSAYMDWRIKRLTAEKEFYRAELIRDGHARWVMDKEKDAA